MTGLVRKATLLVVLGLVAAVCVATAGIPYVPNCTIPAYINLVGCNGVGVVDPYGAFIVTVKDIGNFPVIGSVVSVSFNTDVKIYDGGFPEFVSCQVAQAVTNVSGVATFAGIPGAGRGGVYTGAAAAAISADGYSLGTAHVSTPDENGGGSGTLGVEIGDLGAWATDYKNAASPPVMRRSDFNNLGTVEIGDLGRWATIYKSEASASDCGALCP